jgi:hypothetical protein
VSTSQSPLPVAFRLKRPYSSEDEFLEGDGPAVWRTGMVLIGAGARPEGLIVRFELALQDGTPLFRGEGKVVSHRTQPSDERPPGLEIQFLRLDPRGKTMLERLLRQRHTSLRPPPPDHESADVAPVSLPPPPATPSDEIVSERVARAPADPGSGNVAAPRSSRKIVAPPELPSAEAPARDEERNVPAATRTSTAPPSSSYAPVSMSTLPRAQLASLRSRFDRAASIEVPPLEVRDALLAKLRVRAL